MSRFGGYRMRDVDEFLDRLTESTEALVAENERLRAGGAPIVGTSDLDEVNRQADEILQRARERGGADRRGGRGAASLRRGAAVSRGGRLPTAPPSTRSSTRSATSCRAWRRWCRATPSR